MHHKQVQSCQSPRASPTCATAEVRLIKKLSLFSSHFTVRPSFLHPLQYTAHPSSGLPTIPASQKRSDTAVALHPTTFPRRKTQTPMYTPFLLRLSYKASLTPLSISVYNPSPSRSAYDVCTSLKIKHVSLSASFRFPHYRYQTHLQTHLVLHRPYTVPLTSAASPDCSSPPRYSACIVGSRMKVSFDCL